MRRPAIVLFALCCTALFFGCTSPQSNVAPPPASTGIHAPEGTLTGGEEATDTSAPAENEDAGFAETDVGDKDSEAETETKTDCTTIATHTIEVAAKTTLKEDKEKQAPIPISVKGGSGKFKWSSISPSTLPGGMYLQEGRGGRSASILGTPVQPGTFQPLIKVRDEACDRNAEKQTIIEVTPVVSTPVLGPGTLAAPPAKPAVRLVLDSSGASPKDVFLFDDKPHDEGHFSSQVKIVVQPTGQNGNDFPIPEGRYNITYRYYHTFLKSDGSAGSEGCNATYAATHSACYLTLENGADDYLHGSPLIDEVTEYEFVVIDTQADNATYKYLLYAKKGCRTLNLNDAHLLIKVAYAKTYDKGYCYSGGDHHVTMAGAGLSNSRYPMTTTDSKNHWMRGGIYRSTYRLTSEESDNTIKTNPKEITFAPDDRRVASYAPDVPRCLEALDQFGLWFKEGGCAGSKPDFRVLAVEVKACPVEERLKQESTKDCWFASYYKSGDYVGWNSVGNYGERVGNFNFDRLPDTNMESWSAERDIEVIDVFNALEVPY